MALRSWISRAAVLSGAPGLRALDVSREEWQRISQDFAAAGGRLLAIWGSGAQYPDSVICARTSRIRQDYWSRWRSRPGHSLPRTRR